MNAPQKSAARDISAPPPRQLLLETRVLAEAPLFLLRTLSVRGLPRGDGHAVMILPGFGADDHFTAPLRRALRKLGYASYGWAQGRNLGMRRHIRQALSERLQALYDRHGPVSLVGWSLGGVFAREFARHQPELIRDVYTLGSPINGNPEANNVHRLFQLANRGRDTAKTDWEGFNKRRQAPPVPCTALYSKQDGIVTWCCCLEEPAPNTENVEVGGSHFGLVFNPEVLKALATRLAAPR